MVRKVLLRILSIKVNQENLNQKLLNILGKLELKHIKAD